MRAPRICSCGRVVAHGATCVCRQRRKAEAEKTRPGARARGYDGKWQKARESFLREHPFCAMCDRPATVVDHIKPHRGDMQLFWAVSNWAPLCRSCHSRKTVSRDGGFGNKVRL